MLPTAVLKTNRTPTSQERDVIKGLLENTDERLAEIRQTIAKYQEEEDALAAAKASYQCALSPIRSLPLDILTEIFIACVDSPDFPSISPCEAPMLLTHICHDFRQLAYSIPSIWASIDIRFDHIQPRSNQDMKRVIQRGRTLVDTARDWLRRSGKSPLYISFQASHSPFADLTNEMVEILLEHTARWKHLSLSFLPGVEPIQGFAALTAADVPLLKSLNIHHRHANGHEEYRNWDILKAPNLKVFSMRGDRIDSTATDWSKLAYLDLDLFRTPNEMVARILLQASNLVECTISINDFTHDGVNTGEIFLPNLQVLEMQGGAENEWWDPNEDISLISRIRAPKLNRLCITNDVNERGIETFLSKCPNLKEVVALCKTPNPRVPDWLSFCPQITSLTLGLPKFSAYSDLFFATRMLGLYSEEDLVPEDVPDRSYFQCWRLRQFIPMRVLESFLPSKTVDRPALCPNLDTFVCYFPVLTSFETLCNFLQFREGAASLPHRKWKHVGLRANITDGGEKEEGLLLDEDNQWPMEFDFDLV